MLQLAKINVYPFFNLQSHQRSEISVTIITGSATI